MDNKANELISKYLELILKINEQINLTRITDPEEAHILHIEDSITALKELNAAPDGLYGDLGSGGGFPGVPLAILSGRKTFLIDSVKKKMNAVSNILKELSLSDQIETYSGRIEELSEIKAGEFSVLTARALSKLPSLMELSSPLLKDGGSLICLKSHTEKDELDSAYKLEDKLGLKLISKRELLLSDKVTYREIITFKKISKPKIKLPRKIGMAQKRPLKE